MKILRTVVSTTHELKPDVFAPVRVVLIVLCCTTLSGCQVAPLSLNAQSGQPTSFELLAERIVTTSLSKPLDAAADLPEWVAYALDHNPEITAAIAQYEIATAQVSQVTALPEPKLSYRYFLEEVETRVGPQKFAVGFSQPLPWLSKLRLQGEAATQQARAAAARVSTVQNRIISDVANAWYELYYFDRALEIMRGNRDLVVHLERVARKRYGSGATGHPDVIRAQVELGKIENDLAGLSDREAPLLARLNAALNRPGQAPIAAPRQASIQRLAHADEEIVRRVTVNNPELRAIELDLEAAAISKQRAKKEFLPDFSFGIDYIATGSARSANVVGSGDDPISAAFTMTLPIHRGKYAAGVRAAESKIVSEKARRDQQLNKLHAETINALFRLKDAERQIDLYQNTLLPKANESLVATQRAYSAGGSTFADLIDAQRVLLMFELAEVRAIADHNLARTSLEELMGAPLLAAARVEESHNE